MIPSENSSKIYNAFYRFVRDGNKQEITKYSKEELEITLLQYAADRNSGPYIAIQRRIDELCEQERTAHSRSERWKDRGIGILIGVLISILGLVIKKLLGW